MQLKSIALAGSRVLGLQAAAEWQHRRRLIVLCYHGVVSQDHRARPYLYRNTVSAAEFESHLDRLEGCNLVSIGQVQNWLQGEAELPARAVLITFDDGYRNNLTLAAKILARRKLPALVSLSTDYIGSERVLWPMEVDMRVLHWSDAKLPMPDGGEQELGDQVERESLAREIRRQCKSLPDEQRQRYLEETLCRQALPDSALDDEELWRFMSWDECRELRDLGIDLASHTCSHPILSRLQPEALARELAESRRQIEAELAADCRVFVYPNGGSEDLSAAVVEAVGQAGYELALTLMDRVNPLKPQPLRIDRIGIPGHCSPEAFSFRSSGLHSLLGFLRSS